MIKRISAAILLIGLFIAIARAQGPQTFGVNDLKIMLADKDITIELQARQIQQLQKDYATLKESCVKP